jgi:hypothetical protein
MKFYISEFYEKLLHHSRCHLNQTSLMTILNEDIMYFCAYLTKKLIKETNAALTMNSLEQNEYGVHDSTGLETI